MRCPRFGFSPCLLRYYCYNCFKTANKEDINSGITRNTLTALPMTTNLLKEEEMRKSNTIKVLALFAVASMVIAACGGGGQEPAATEAGAGGAKVTSTGFECPEPNPRMEVTSTELNVFVWTEYFPQDILDCFELVDDAITLNRDEYSSNEEMYAKLSA